MAGQALLLIRGFNVFADGINVGLPLVSAKIPIPNETGESVTFGGVRGAIEISTSMEAPELTFVTKGLQPDLKRQYAAAFGRRRTYTVLGALVDEMDDVANRRAIPLICTIIGRLGGADIDQMEGGGMPGTNYTVKSVLKQTTVIAGSEIHRYDLRLGGWLDQDGLQLDIANTIGLNA